MSEILVDSTILADGVAKDIDMSNHPAPLTASVYPEGDATVNVWYSLDGGVTFKEWENGEVTTASTDLEKELTFYSGITHLRFQRTAGTSALSTFAVC